MESPGADIVIVLVPPLVLLLVGGQVRVDDTEVGGVKPESHPHPALVT